MSVSLFRHFHNLSQYLLSGFFTPSLHWWGQSWPQTLFSLWILFLASSWLGSSGSLNPVRGCVCRVWASHLLIAPHLSAPSMSPLGSVSIWYSFHGYYHLWAMDLCRIWPTVLMCKWKNSVLNTSPCFSFHCSLILPAQAPLSLVSVWCLISLSDSLDNDILPFLPFQGQCPLTGPSFPE